MAPTYTGGISFIYNNSGLDFHECKYFTAGYRPEYFIKHNTINYLFLYFNYRFTDACWI